MRFRRPRPALLAILLAVVVGSALSACAPSAAPASPSGSPTHSASVPSPSPASSSRGVTAAAIGDSIAIGYGVPAEDAWPLLVADRLDWTLSDFAESAAGFTVKGLNTHTFDDQVSAVIRLHPDVVIVGATRNDVFASTPDLQRAATAALHRLREALPEARIVGVSALWGSDPTPAQVPVISRTVQAAVLDVGGSWVELGQPFAGHPELLISDQVHPTVEGQQLIANAVVRGIGSQLVDR
ncbi:SGNH/GDSL hydrolase family protein [Leifsonia sp. 1010]|uniref:SGNH/GDSL hydrolase family protein n=1 Tax=Leifsonia sp. 1010 TaxID=2817769 RepID=UPI00285E9E16|nr:SGNH/GDSL hydrolase family protein [Leifsonia sp. 1010]MDR6612976.1 lysophospholipase L1-like esterase [Leifsonia sp. 1010]